VSARSPFTAWPPRDPRTVHLGDHRRQRHVQLTGEVLDAAAIGRVSVAQVRGEVLVAELPRAQLALSAKRFGAPPSELAALTAPELQQLRSYELAAQHRRASGWQLTRASALDAGESSSSGVAAARSQWEQRDVRRVNRYSGA
jgi:hypothetical protein